MLKFDITKEEINALDLFHYQGKISVIDSVTEIPAALTAIKKQTIVGFDSESKPVFVKGGYNPTALVQIATPEQIYLFRINKTGFGGGLKTYIENANYTKIGIGLHDDIVDLKKSFQLVPKGFTDLNELVDKTDIKVKGVRKLAGLVLGIRISKGAQTSDWARHTLNQKQINYAATDAWVCLEIFNTLTYQGYL